MNLKIQIKNELLPAIVQEMGFDAETSQISAEEFIHEYVENWLVSLAKQNVRKEREQSIQQQIEDRVKLGDVKKLD